MHWKFCLDQKLKKISNAAKKLCHRGSIPKISLSCQEKYVEWHKRNSWMEQQRHFFKNTFKHGQILWKYTIFGPTCMHLNRHISETTWNWHLAFYIITIDIYRFCSCFFALFTIFMKVYDQWLMNSKAAKTAICNICKY